MNQSKSLSLPHLVRMAEGEAATPPLLLLLHGYGSNEQDLFGLTPYLDARFLVLSVRAPYTLMPGGYAWFELAFTDAGMISDMAQAESSRTRLVQFIGEAIAAYDADPTQVYLLGFSQGAIMSAGVLLTEPEVVAGAALLSGSVPQEPLAGMAEAARLRGKPVLILHGLYDDVLPIEHGHQSRDLFSTLPVDLEYHEYPMGHEISADSLNDLIAWLVDQLED
jgi:phospholipase/carboxylesterase